MTRRRGNSSNRGVGSMNFFLEKCFLTPFPEALSKPCHGKGGGEAG